jgi:glycosyltransferase involved in cell wall biosynthesis
VGLFIPTPALFYARNDKTSQVSLQFSDTTIVYNPRMPVVSILMPCFNAGKTINAALESIASQTLSDFELVLVNDGSTDDTAEIIDQWSIRDNRIKKIQLPHSGIITALNHGLRECSSELVARMDADDWMYPERLERQVNHLNRNPDTGVVSCLVEAFPLDQVREGFRVYVDWLNSLIGDGHIKRELFIESPLPHPSVMFRKHVVVGHGEYQEMGWAEDYDLWLRLAQQGVHFNKVPELLLKWREHTERLTRVDNRYSLENFLRAKAYYLSKGLLKLKKAVFIWGAGMTGRRISKHLQRNRVPLVGFFDVDPAKIGKTLRGLPIRGIQEIPRQWQNFESPVLLAAVSSRNARPKIRTHLENMDLIEGIDWWCVA